MLKNLLILSAFSAFAVVVIISLNIYHNYTLSSLPKTTKTRIIPLKPNFDTDTIEELKKRTPIGVNLSEKTEVVSEDAQGLSTTPTPSPDTQETSSTSAQTNL